MNTVNVVMILWYKCSNNRRRKESMVDEPGNDGREEINDEFTGTQESRNI